MKKGFIILAVVVILVLYIMNKVNTAKQLEFTVGVPSNVSVRGGNLTFDLPITAQNVSSGSVRIKSLDFDVFSAGKYIGKAIMSQPTTVTPNGNTVLRVSVSISFFDLGTAAGSIVNYFKRGKVSLKLDGLVYAEGFQVPVSQSFDFDLKNVA